MTEKSRRQLYLLAGLLVLLVIVVVMVSRRSGGDTSAATGRPAGSRARPSNSSTRGAAQQDVPMLDVRLEALQRGSDELPETDRNPFRFRPKATPPPRPPSPQAQQRPQTYVPPAPTGPPPPPPIPLRYIGLLGAPTAPDRVAVLSDARGNPIYGKEGDIIEGRYRVLRIAGDSVDLAYTDGRGRQTLRLSTQ